MTDAVDSYIVGMANVDLMLLLGPAGLGALPFGVLLLEHRRQAKHTANEWKRKCGWLIPETPCFRLFPEWSE